MWAVGTCANCHMTNDVTMAAECADTSTSGLATVKS